MLIGRPHRPRRAGPPVTARQHRPRRAGPPVTARQHRPRRASPPEGSVMDVSISAGR